MNAPIGQKNRPYQAVVSVMNAEPTLNITTGMAVCDPVDLTSGYGVVLASSAIVGKSSQLIRGIAAPADGSAAPGSWFDIVVCGMCNSTRLVRGTRAATTDAWPSFAAIGIGDVMSIDTAVNGIAFSTSALAAPGAAGIVGLGMVGGTATAVSQTTAASGAYSAFNGQTAYTVGVRTWLRLL